MATSPEAQAAQFRIPTPQELGFDPLQLRSKYADERERRLRSEGNDQYREITGDLEKFNDDPYIDQVLVREPISASIHVLIVGGGFGGQLAAARLKEAGFDDFRIIEKAGDFGGTWYWNRYPGAQCDIEAYVYLPLLEETNYIPKEKYSYAPEILEHARRIGRHFDLYPRTCFQTQVRTVRWVEGDKRWHVSTDRGDLFKARHVIMSSGPLNRPKLPGIPGIEKFKGHTFHTSRWDYDYCGGSSSGGMTKLADKRVGIIGTGATAIQCVPYLARDAKHLTVFQRTPSAIDERGNRPTDPNWAKSLQPGWHAERNENFVSILSGIPQEEDMVGDRWTDLFKALSKLMSVSPSAGMTAEDIAFMGEIADYQKMNYIRDRVAKSVTKAEVAEKLKPWYRQWCKRPTFNDEFLPTFNRDNVTLVDTEGKGVERVTEKGVVVNGVEYEVDCLIFATGFEVGTAYTRRSEFEVYGKTGESLSDYWKNGLRTFHGFHAHGFPNCYHMGLTQTGLAPNFTYMLDRQATHIAYLLKELKARGKQVLETSLKAEDEWQDIVHKPNFMADYLAKCTPGYYNAEGKVGDGKSRGFFEEQYEGAAQFYAMLERWRKDDRLDGLELS
ncbi:MAG: NAD(P)/FAD-dependent oxidoreductase [Gammaproteobacteria bacterium]|nr:NAD(P)/FAD-dependent oxidoreductase [Gammaproteobacteria bacterium]